MIEPQKLYNRAETLCLTRWHLPLQKASAYQLHDALSHAVMEEITPRWIADQEKQQQERCAIYMSAEFLIGRMVYNNLYSLGILEETKKVFLEKGVDLCLMEDVEDASLGNGGLGRLAACFLDSAATHAIPLMGYGLRYRYGLFKQLIVDDRQREEPDDWTHWGDPWSIRRLDLAVTVPMTDGALLAVPYDMPVIGYGEGSIIGTLRLWQTESLHELDIDLFNAQDYAAASADKNVAEDVIKLLYPNDSLLAGKIQRIKQQYVLCSASLQDMLRVFEEQHGTDYSRFPEFYAVQLNDTHPTMCIPELIRLLGLKGIEFDAAFDIAKKTFAYTNHTVMQEALEKWNIDLLAAVSADLAAIIRRLDARQNMELRKMRVTENLDKLLLLQDNSVHMAYLAMYGGHAVNGVAAIHSQILKDDVLHAWYELSPEMFSNKTNGITQRRWLGLCNPELTALISRYVEGDFIRQPELLSGLAAKMDDTMLADFIQVKKEKKKQLADYIFKQEGVRIPEHFVFDVQVKRLHEYKRQLLNALSILAIYQGLKDGTIQDLPPVAFIFGAKSAPGYARAKSIIYFICKIADMINNDPFMQDKMRVVFVHNYNCSYAEKIIPAADISEQISPAGTEASGTGNMKLMMNGAVTLGTYDGANIEIVNLSGAENNYIFGATLDQIEAAKPTYSSLAIYDNDPVLERAVDTLLTVEDPTGGLKELYNSLLYGASWHKPDHYYLFLDFHSYLETKLRCIRDTRDEKAFAAKCLRCVSASGQFSSDRTVKEYASEIWHV